MNNNATGAEGRDEPVERRWMKSARNSTRGILKMVRWRAQQTMVRKRRSQELEGCELLALDRRWTGVGQAARERCEEQRGVDRKRRLKMVRIARN